VAKCRECKRKIKAEKRLCKQHREESLRIETRWYNMLRSSNWKRPDLESSMIGTAAAMCAEFGMD
jgi:bisphosphoglycerate-independent phosphoglycerate mutase (AlkP superfamily)